MSLNQISYFIPNYPNLSVSGAISSASAQITTLTASNIAITNNLSVAGTLTTVNLTTTNLIDTNITAGSANITNATIATARITSNLLALGNSNTLGNLFTTGDNVIIGTTSNALSMMPGYIWNGTQFVTSANAFAFDLPGAGTISFSDNIICNGGSIGIGTTAPGSPLEILSSINPHVKLINTSASANGTPVEIYFDRTAVSSTLQAAIGVGGNTGRPFFIWVNGTDRINIDSNGNVGIGNHSPGSLLTIGNSAAVFTASGVGDQFLVHANGSNSGSYFYYNAGNGYGTISDRRTKTDITPIDTQDALAFISNITPSDFVLNGQTERQSGFIAQNVLAAVQNDAQKSAIAKWETYDETDPECPFMGISDRPILSNLVAVVKYQQTEIDTLKATNASLLQFIQSKFPGEFSL